MTYVSLNSAKDQSSVAAVDAWIADGGVVRDLDAEHAASTTATIDDPYAEILRLLRTGAVVRFEHVNHFVTKRQLTRYVSRARHECGMTVVVVKHGARVVGYQLG